ncbi:electron transport complex protein RnfB [Rhodobacter aestuarii]|uniref:Ion-translocating oxidoreductase complex subunit B n=1 Tax=Rhodobacter aestuarii TaxID=453582 RepID=A0A1N7J8K5_9RHOB|nr:MULTISPECIES: RnfABCDGE type electron transport complex subunit B [Rhodobacter]PTV97064.1 electron transport complex protein RnfB [Rhodobacter aestuarii]SIS45688.1 electron transport complex protein RnfB [Rhodobacter aestuarii]SOB98396.1 electron transport complex protein RnfB [Rhodobacter sp. JA431]
MIEAVAAMSALGTGLGLMLGFAARKFHVEAPPVVDAIDAILPGTNCGACGYPGCHGLAEAMAAGEAPVTACTPGGRDLALELAQVVTIEGDGALSGMAEVEPMVAFIFEDHCTGCTKCFKRCPTDAIIGANRQIHTVITDACTGCDACIEVCPTEAIVKRVKPKSLRQWYWDKPEPRLGAASTERAA